MTKAEQQGIHEGVDVLHWIPLELQEPEYGQRVLIFAPCYPVGDQMRVRIVSWVTKFMDATHWAAMPAGPSNTLASTCAPDCVPASRA